MSPPPELHLSRQSVPGKLEQAQGPLGNAAVEPVQVSYSPPGTPAAL
jgi:hypothetical protein